MRNVEPNTNLTFADVDKLLKTGPELFATYLFHVLKSTCSDQDQWPTNFHVHEAEFCLAFCPLIQVENLWSRIRMSETIKGNVTIMAILMNLPPIVDNLVGRGVDANWTLDATSFTLQRGSIRIRKSSKFYSNTGLT